MAIFDIFKSKNEEIGKKESKEQRKEVSKKEPVLNIKKEKKAKIEEKKEPAKSEPVKIKKTASDLAYKVLHFPHVTEKATILSEVENAYVFKVDTSANKTEIKKAVESVYGVDVVRVRVVNIPRKRKRVGKQMGWSQGYKKAIVKVKEGQKVEILSR
jgi:large subunit ribosomal protein L23